MEISVSKKNNNYGIETPVTNTIIVSSKEERPKTVKLNIDIDELLEDYVDKAENFGEYDIDLEDKILSLGINKDIWVQMKNELLLLNTGEYATNIEEGNYPAFTGFINFPWREWKEKLLTIQDE